MTSQTTIEVESNETCRICFETSTELFSPCKCSGSVKYVHESCLQKWTMRSIEQEMNIYKVQNYFQSHQNMYAIECEICSGKIFFKMEREKIYRKCEDVKKQCEKKKLKLMFYILSLIVAITVMSVLTAEGIKQIEDATKSAVCFVFGIVVVLILAKIIHLMIEEFCVGAVVKIGFLKKRKSK